MDLNKISPMLDDDRMRQLMHDLPHAPEDPWFVRKVLNRLPDTSSDNTPGVVKFIYAVCFFIIILGWCYFAYSVLSSSDFVLMLSDVIYLLILVLFTVAIPVSYQSS